MKKEFITLLIIFIFITLTGSTQVVYEHVSNKNIYDFLDELANDKIIEINSIIKPYSRKYIADKLLEAKQNGSQLNKRQKEDVDFYLKSFQLELPQPLSFPEKTDVFRKNRNLFTAINPLGIYYKDDVFTFSFKPILGYEYSVNNTGIVTHSWGGAEIYGYIGKHLSFYTSLRDNNVSQMMIKPEYFVRTQGVPFKNFGEEGIDYSEARGGIFYSWKWGSIGLVKDHVQWGNNYHGSNIFSGRTPSFAMIKLNLKPVKWFEFNYFHGWLVSEVVDSARSYWTNNVYRIVYFPKYIAANMFTFTPVKRLNISIGNSVVYSNLGGVHAAYLIPFLFYKSVDHTLNSTNKDGETGQNSQMFFDISSRNIKHLHLFFTWFIDDFSVTHFTKPDELNLFGYKFGFRLSDYPFENISLTAEYTLTNPLVYQHKIETTTFESNKYNLGHYLRDNSQELYLAIQYKPIRGLHILTSYTFAQHGADYKYENVPPGHLHKLPLLKNITWESHSILISANYEIVNNAYVYIKYQNADITGKLKKYTPEFYRGNTNTFSMGVNLGF